LPVIRFAVIAAAAASLALSACATSTPSADSPAIASAPAAGGANTPVVNSASLRELTPDEKIVVVAAVAPSLRDPTSAKYRWTKLSTVPADDGSFNYCAMVDAKSPYAAYDGRQAYIIEVKLTLGKVSSAVMGLIAGGKDVAIVSKMCAKYGLNPNSAT
jgi:ABC-type Fe3+-hydroxamate transport system substrate-binding protein